MFRWLEQKNRHVCEVQMINPIDIFAQAQAPSRRKLITGMAAAMGCLAAGSAVLAQSQEPPMPRQPGTPASKFRTTLHYEIDMKPAPERIYAVLLDAKQFAAFSGMPAEIDPAPGGVFSLFGGLIVGRTIETVANVRIVQAWRPTHWDPGVYSIAHFELKPRGTDSTLIFDHTGFPAGEADSLDSGWKSHYWEPMKKFFA
jgi:activator of HSP90 ATPase